MGGGTEASLRQPAVRRLCLKTEPRVGDARPIMIFATEPPVVPLKIRLKRLALECECLWRSGPRLHQFFQVGFFILRNQKAIPVCVQAAIGERKPDE